MTEANRDAAIEWANRATTALAAGDRERACQLFEKSLRLYHDGRVAAMLQAARSSGGHAPSDSSRSAGGGGGGTAPSAAGSNRAASGVDGVRRRPAAAQATRVAAAPPPKPRGTPEQEAFVAEQLRFTEPYAILRVPRDANPADIERSFKRLALKLHPDKNPVGTEAFQKLSAAYEVLRDPERRQKYDQYGDTGGNDAAAPMRAGMGHPFAQAQGAHDGIDVDEFLRAAFFGGMGPGVHVHMGGMPFRRAAAGMPRRRPAGTETGDGGGVSIANLMNMLAVVFVLLLFSLSSGGSRAPLYSLDKTGAYAHSHSTGEKARDVVAGLPYYVTSETSLKMTTDHYLQQRVERSVQVDWHEALQEGCAKERQRRSQLTTQLAYAVSENRRAALKKQLAEVPTSSCDQYEQYFGRRRR